MSIDHFTPITAAWLAVSLTALFFSVLNLQSSRHDVKASRRVKNYRRETRLVIATGAVHRNLVKLAIFAWWSFLGVLFGLFKPPPELGLAGLMGLVATALGMAYVGFHETRERSVMADLLADDIAEDVLEEHNEQIADVAERKESDAERRVHEAGIAQATVRAADRMQKALESTAANTEQIAKNTERSDGAA